MATGDELLADEVLDEEADETGEQLNAQEPQAGGDLGNGEGKSGPLTFEEEVAARRTLGNLQPHVTAGIGPIGKDNAVVLTCVST
jgi:hypothetical protein